MTISEFRELDVYEQVNFAWDNDLYRVYEDIMSDDEYHESIEDYIHEGGLTWQQIRDYLNELETESDTGYWYRDPYGSPRPIDTGWEIQEYITDPIIEEYGEWEDEEEYEEPTENVVAEEFNMLFAVGLATA